MSGTVWSCMRDESAESAARVMWDRNVGAVAVTDGEGKLVGIVTDRDICMLAYFNGTALATLPVAAAMSNWVFTVGPDETIPAAEQLMRSNQIRRLPVVENGKAVGMLSLGDIARVEASGALSGNPDPFAVVVSEIVKPREHIGNLVPAAPRA